MVRLLRKDKSISWHIWCLISYVALAAGMMIAASFSLVYEGSQVAQINYGWLAMLQVGKMNTARRREDERTYIHTFIHTYMLAPTSHTQGTLISAVHHYIHTLTCTCTLVQENQASIRTAIGFVFGMSFVYLTKTVLNHFQGVESTDINPANLRKMILILFVMTLHSLSEGIGIGRVTCSHTYTRCRIFEGLGSLLSAILSLFHILRTSLRVYIWRFASSQCVLLTCCYQVFRTYI